MPAQGKYSHLSGRGAGMHKMPDVPRDDILPGGIADAVLAALPYRVGVLDQAGTIIAVNDLWRRFVRDHGALALSEGRHVFVSGGSDVYRLALPVANKLFLTMVHAEFAGDAYFPEFDPGEWVLTSTEEGPPPQDGPRYSFQVYERARMSRA